MWRQFCIRRIEELQRSQAKAGCEGDDAEQKSNKCANCRQFFRNELCMYELLFLFIYLLGL